jgi:hypothetical protein
MYRKGHVFVCVALLMAVVSCGKPADISKAINDPSAAEPKAQTVRTNSQPGPQQQSPVAQPPVQASAPTGPPRILTKDPEYKALIKPPEGDGFLKLYSTDYNAKMAEVEASVAKISDKGLQEKARQDAWKNVDKTKFREQAVETHATKLREYMAKHRDGWVEVGHCDYDTSTEMFRVYSIPASPFQGTNKFETHIDIATIDAVYNKFRSLADPRIMDRINQDVVEYFATEDSPVYSREQVTTFLRQQRYKSYESRIRLEQMVLIGRGDLADKNIEHISIVDYPTETVLLDMEPQSFIASKPTWLY